MVEKNIKRLDPKIRAYIEVHGIYDPPKLSPDEAYEFIKSKKTVLFGDYIGTYVPNHPKCNSRGYVLQHRAIYECIEGRLLEWWEYIHHVNSNKLDNRPSNLRLSDVRTHAREHRQKLEIGRGAPSKPDNLKIEEMRSRGWGAVMIAKMLNYDINYVRRTMRVIDKQLDAMRKAAEA